MPAMAGTCGCATWWRPDCIARILLLRPVTTSEATRVAATLRACGLRRHAGRQFLSLVVWPEASRVVGARVGSTSGLVAARRTLQRARPCLSTSHRCGARGRAPPRPILGGRRAHRAADVPRGTGRLLELADGEVRAVRRMLAADLERLSTAGGGERRRGPCASAREPRPRRPAPPCCASRRCDLYVEYRSVLRNLNWQVRKGEHWAVYGANGSGKSSLLKLLYGDLSPALGGRIERSGFPKAHPLPNGSGRSATSRAELQSDYAIDVTVFDLVASGRHSSIGLVDEPTAQDRRVAARWLKFFGLLVGRQKPASRIVLRATAPRAHCARHGGGSAHAIAG